MHCSQVHFQHFKEPGSSSDSALLWHSMLDMLSFKSASVTGPTQSAGFEPASVSMGDVCANKDTQDGYLTTFQVTAPM